MFKRKNKNLPEQGRDRRARQGSPTPNPAFSYYANRTPEPGSRLVEQRTETAEQGVPKPRTWKTQAPFWFLLLVAVVCAGKLLLLTTDPKIVLLGKNDISSSYLQSTQAYEAAASKLLASSFTNHTKITANLDGTANALRQQFPELQAVSITLPLIGNRPIVYMQAAQPSVIVQSAHGNYALNKTGLVLAKVVSLPSGVPLVVDQSTAAKLVPGKRYLPGSAITFIQTLDYQLTTAKLGVSVYVLPADNPYELDVRLEGKQFLIRCNLAGAALVQSGAAVATLNHLGASLPGSYIDVRTPDRVYYK